MVRLYTCLEHAWTADKRCHLRHKHLHLDGGWPCTLDTNLRRDILCVVDFQVYQQVSSLAQAKVCLFVRDSFKCPDAFKVFKQRRAQSG